ncbi:CsbD family protein [Streptomyces sp. NPDC002795]|uniref:CsbD family protein n=1 Tax=Streptomyces sp. NPDC002795 TaxID=3364665 RepID=UPI0036BCA4DA
MSIGRTIRNTAQAMKGKFTHRAGEATRNRRMQREGRTDQMSGNLKQSTQKAKDAFRR